MDENTEIQGGDDKQRAMALALSLAKRAGKNLATGGEVKEAPQCMSEGGKCMSHGGVLTDDGKCSYAYGGVVHEEELDSPPEEDEFFADGGLVDDEDDLEFSPTVSAKFPGGNEKDSGEDAKRAEFLKGLLLSRRIRR